MDILFGVNLRAMFAAMERREILLMYGFTRDLFICALSVSPHRISLAQAIVAVEGDDTADGPACMHCGSSETKRSYPLGRYTLWQCHRCDHFTVSLDGLFRLFYHFTGILKSTAKKHLAKDVERPGQMKPSGIFKNWG